jgi:hypothetical protein
MTPALTLFQIKWLKLIRLDPAKIEIVRES